MKFNNFKCRIVVTIFLAMVLLYIYAESLFILGYQWYRAEEYWRYFVFPVCLYLMWHDRRRLLNIEVVPSYWSGIPFLVLGCFSFIVWNITTIDVSIEIGIVLLTLGISLLFYGCKVTAQTWIFICYLLIATSVTDRLMGFIAIYLQNISAIVSTGFLNATAWPVLLSERTIRLPYGFLEVAKSCSGTAQLTALIALSIPLGYVRHNSFLVRAILVVITLPITIFFNSFRIVLIAIWNYNGMHTLVHGPNDILKLPIIFPFAVLMVYGVSVFLERFENSNPSFSSETNSLSGSNNPKKILPGAYPLGIACGLLAATFGTIIYFYPKPVSFPFQKQDIPLSFSGWSGQDIDIKESGYFLGNPDFLIKRYFTSANGVHVELQITYFKAQTVAKRITTQYYKPICGDVKPIVVTLKDSRKITLKKETCISAKNNFSKLSWFVSEGKVYYNGNELRKNLIRRIFKDRRNNAAFVTLAVWAKNDGYSYSDTTDELLNNVVDDFYPFIETFLSF